MKNLLACFFVPHPPLVVPAVGRGQEKAIPKTVAAYEEMARQIEAYAPDTIIFVSPHATVYQDYYRIEKAQHNRGDFGNFDAPKVAFEVEQDLDFIKELESLAIENSFPAGTKGRQNTELDHGIMVPLYFIHSRYQKFKVVRLSFSGLSYLSHYEYGKILQTTIFENPEKKFVFVASGDLSHMLKENGPYGFSKEGPLFDQAIGGILDTGDFLELFKLDHAMIERAGECGFRSLMILAGLLDGYAVTPKLLSYEGPFGVGYAVALFTPDCQDEQRNFGDKWKEIITSEIQKTRDSEDSYIALARHSLEHYVLTGSRLKLDRYPPGIGSGRAGVFVSIHKEGQLRGCIGTIKPTTETIAHEIVQNAVSAGIEDPRFQSVETDELPYLVYSVDILKTPERIASPAELDIKKYGVIVRCGSRSGLLLPNIDGIDSVKQQIDIARQKGGIDKNEPYTLERFEVVRHE